MTSLCVPALKNYKPNLVFCGCAARMTEERCTAVDRCTALQQADEHKLRRHLCCAVRCSGLCTVKNLQEYAALRVCCSRIFSLGSQKMESAKLIHHIDAACQSDDNFYFGSTDK